MSPLSPNAAPELTAPEAGGAGGESPSSGGGASERRTGGAETAVDTTADGLAENPAGPAVPGGDVANLASGTTIADCTIESVIGEGGSSVVYLARQRGIDRRVAVKVLRAPAASRHARWRFSIEAQVLGRLEHPGIARVYGSGVAADGHPYLIMQYIDGRPITEACAGLGARDKVRLFLGVCDAVQAAHRSGVIHRDIKPGNVLVETGESGATVKLLDFGIARLTGESVIHTAHTHAGTLLGTAAYMSPEQAAGHHDDVGTTSDVFSLGVLLFEVLTGRTPRPCFGGSAPESARLPLDEQLRRLRTDPVPPLSRFDRSLRGDLETVIARAVDLIPARRYQSPGEFRADLTRWLENRPVEARRPGAWYRGRLWVRRHRAAAATIAVVLGLAGFAAVMGQVARRLERREYESALSHYALLLDSLVDEAAKRAATREFREDILQAAAAGIERDLARRPDDPRLLSLLAKATAGIGSIRLEQIRYDEARILQGKALSLRERVVAARPRDRAARLALCEQTVRVGDIAGRTDPAERRALYARAHDELLALCAEDAADARALDSLAWSYERLGVLTQRERGSEAALPYFRSQLAAAEALLNLEPASPSALYALGEGLQQLGGALVSTLPADTIGEPGRTRLAEFERIAIRGLDVARHLKSVAPDQFRSTHVLVRSLTRVSYLHRRDGHPEDAGPFADEALEEAEHLIGLDPHNSVAVWCMLHALDEGMAVHGELGRHEEVYRSAAREIVLIEQAPGGGRPGTDFAEALSRAISSRDLAAARLASANDWP